MISFFLILSQVQSLLRSSGMRSVGLRFTTESSVMKRRTFAILLAVLLVGVMGNGGTGMVQDPWIKFDNGSPNGNKPGGVANRLEGKGTYDTGGGVAISVTLFASQPPLFSSNYKADYLNGNWGATMPLAPGAYKCGAGMTTTTNGTDRIYTFNDDVDVTVK